MGGRIGATFHHFAMQIVGVIVVVVINRQALRVLAEQLDERRVVADLLRMPGTADVAVQADHLIRGAHH